MSTASTIPFHLRPHKAIERNVFIELLKRLDRSHDIEIKDYKYVGLGGPFLEDFKMMHLEFSILNMDCIEIDLFAYSRQVFNNPYSFIHFFNESSTDYISGPDFSQDQNQVIWLDYAIPKELSQQLRDIELLGEKLASRDIVKFSFNASLQSFCWSHHVSGNGADLTKVLKFLKDHATYQLFLPDEITAADLEDFPAVIRSMATRALRRGLSKAASGKVFSHLASFTYSDGQSMTTMTGVITDEGDFQNILDQSGLVNWQFYHPDANFIEGHEISVPTMTIAERIEIDKKMPVANSEELANNLAFFYGIDADDHRKLIEGYSRYYKYLPYYSKVTY